MIFYSILSFLALLGILIVFWRHFKVGETPEISFWQSLKDQVHNLQKLRALRKVAKQHDQAHLKQAESFFEKETGKVRDELWQQKSTADICFLVEDELAANNAKQALVFLDFLADRYHEREVQEYIYSLFVTAYEQSGKNDAALMYCHKLLEMSPGDLACMLKIANFQYQQREYKKAEELLARVLEMDQSNLGALDLLAGIYAKTFRTREAEEMKRKVVALRMAKKT